MRYVLAIIFVLFTHPAFAGQIDYFCIFTDQSTAQANVHVGAFWDATNATWNQSTTFPNVKVATPAALINGISPITGFWIVVSRPSADVGLDGDAACVMKLDRDLGKVNGAFVLGATITGINRTSLSFQPIPLGSAYPRPLGK